MESVDEAYRVFTCSGPSCNVAASLVEHGGGYYLRLLRFLLDLTGAVPKVPQEVTLALAAQRTE